MALPNHDRYRDYTDEELEAFLNAFSDHVDRPLVVRERELRSQVKSEVAASELAQGRYRANEERPKATLTPGKSRWFWAKVAGVAAIIGIIAVVLQATRVSIFRRATTTSQTSVATSPRTVPDDVLSMPSPTEETPLAELLASPTPSPTVAPE